MFGIIIGGPLDCFKGVIVAVTDSMPALIGIVGVTTVSWFMDRPTNPFGYPALPSPISIDHTLQS